MKQTKVALRSRPISRNRRSLYLDYYPAIRNAEMKTIRQETLGIYIFDKPRSSMQKLHNEEILAKAELIRCYRVAELINRNIGYIRKAQSGFSRLFQKSDIKAPSNMAKCISALLSVFKGTLSVRRLGFQIMFTIPRVSFRYISYKTGTKIIDQYCCKLFEHFPMPAQNGLPR